MLDILNSDKIIGHAICLVGLKRTGKSILLSQLHSNSMSFGVEANEILHITLGVKINDRKVDRDSLNINRVQGASKIEFPKLSDIQELISELKIYQDIKCVMIDEITLCEDFILAGKSFIDGLVNSGIKVILAGTESASFIEANENSLYTRLILEDISYIPFGEYCRLKKLPLNTLEEKQNAMDRYIEHGNILDDTISVDDKYIESAVGINVALSIINTDYEDFIGCEHNTKELIQSVIKYIKLIGELITIKAVQAEISRADISRVFGDGNRSRKTDARLQNVTLTRSERKKLAITGAEEVYKEYGLEFGVSKIRLSDEQLTVIDSLFTKMGLLYNLSIIPEVAGSDGSVNAEDLCTLHSLSYNITEATANKILSKHQENVSEEDIRYATDSVKSTAKGRIIEEIVTLQFIKGIEKKKDY